MYILAILLLKNRLFKTIFSTYKTRLMYMFTSEHNPDDTMIDFKIASINTAAANFPGIEMRGCFYHLSTNFWKRIQQSGQQGRYTNEDDFANILRVIPALVFVPPDNVVAYFEELSDHLRNAFKEACNNLLNLLRRFRRNTLRRAPLFSIRLWDMFQRRLDKLPRTTNCIVGWHRSFQQQ